MKKKSKKKSKYDESRASELTIKFPNKYYSEQEK
jgi:hypothetical protein